MLQHLFQCCCSKLPGTTVSCSFVFICSTCCLFLDSKSAEHMPVLQDSSRLCGLKAYQHCALVQQLLCAFSGTFIPHDSISVIDSKTYIIGIVRAPSSLSQPHLTKIDSIPNQRFASDRQLHWFHRSSQCCIDKETSKLIELKSPLPEGIAKIACTVLSRTNRTPVCRHTAENNCD